MATPKASIYDGGLDKNAANFAPLTPLQFLDAVGGLIGDGTRVPMTLLERAPATELPHARIIDAHTAELMRWLM